MKGLYLHIPFCNKKCTYCDFYSIESTSLIDTFVNNILIELELRSFAGANDTVDTVFLGGGTPSLLSVEQLTTIMDCVRLHYKISAEAEITMECNPGTIDVDKLIGYRKAGVNRLSFGVQSFVAEELSFLTRIHTAQEARDAMKFARAAGFNNVNMDLMFALPPQTLESLSYNLEQMLELQPNHISAYSLVYESGTPLHSQLLKGAVKPHEEELDAEMYALVVQTLTEAGYLQYEVSNFSQPGFDCKHNLKYWHGAYYIAVGPSAHGLYDGTRYWNHRSLTAWSNLVSQRTLPEANHETVTPQMKAQEVAFLSLRANGINTNRFSQEFSINIIEALKPHLNNWVAGGFVVVNDTTIRLTPAGYAVCDEISVKVLELLDAYCASNNRT